MCVCVCMCVCLFVCLLLLLLTSVSPRFFFSLLIRRLLRRQRSEKKKSMHALHRFSLVFSFPVLFSLFVNCCLFACFSVFFFVCLFVCFLDWVTHVEGVCVYVCFTISSTNSYQTRKKNESLFCQHIIVSSYSFRSIHTHAHITWSHYIFSFLCFLYYYYY